MEGDQRGNGLSPDSVFQRLMRGHEFLHSSRTAMKTRAWFTSKPGSLSFSFQVMLLSWVFVADRDFFSTSEVIIPERCFNLLCKTSYASETGEQFCFEVTRQVYCCFLSFFILFSLYIFIFSGFIGA